MGNLTRIVEQDDAVRVGRLVPDDDSLVIGTGRALNLAVLFLDICGFSSRPGSDHKEQAVLLRFLNLFFTEMVHIVEDYGGTVEKNTGDGLMAYFENAASFPADSVCMRAVAASLTMMHANEHLIGPIFSGALVSPFQFRIGIDYGPVTIARLGAHRRFNANVAIGTSANIASKLLDRASPNSILIGEDVKDRLPSGWLQYTRYVGPSGFERSNHLAYLTFEYTGRWKT